MLIKGSNLTPAQSRQVFNAFVHRHLAIGPSRRYTSNEAWLVDHAFYFLRDGSRLALRPSRCEPHYMAGSQ